MSLVQSTIGHNGCTGLCVELYTNHSRAATFAYSFVAHSKQIDSDSKIHSDHCSSALFACTEVAVLVLFYSSKAVLLLICLPDDAVVRAGSFKSMIRARSNTLDDC